MRINTEALSVDTRRVPGRTGRSPSAAGGGPSPQAEGAVA